MPHETWQLLHFHGRTCAHMLGLNGVACCPMQCCCAVTYMYYGRRRAPRRNIFGVITGEGLSVSQDAFQLRLAILEHVLQHPSTTTKCIFRERTAVFFCCSAEEFFHHQRMAPQSHVRHFLFLRGVFMGEHHDLLESLRYCLEWHDAQSDT